MKGMDTLSLAQQEADALAAMAKYRREMARRLRRPSKAPQLGIRYGSLNLPLMAAAAKGRT